MSFEITTFLIEDIKRYIARDMQKELLTLFEEIHFADVAEILDELNWDEAVYLLRLLDLSLIHI